MVSTSHAKPQDDPTLQQFSRTLLRRVLPASLVIVTAVFLLVSTGRPTDQEELTYLKGAAGVEEARFYGLGDPAVVSVVEEVSPMVDGDSDEEKVTVLRTDGFVPTGLVGKAPDLNYPNQTLIWFEAKDTNDGNKKLNQTIPFSMMFVGHNRKILYCPNAKAGTSTIKEVFKLEQRCLGNCANAAHRQFEGNKKERERIMNSKPLSLTHVRNPFDRIWSTYKGKIISCKIPLKSSQEDCKKQPPTFVEFLDYISDHPEVKNVHWQSFSGRCLVTPDKDGKVFRYDHVLRLEDDLMKGLSRVEEEAGLKVRSVTPEMFLNTEHSVAARHAFYDEEAKKAGLTLQELVAKVYAMYKEDIDGLGYSFEKYGASE